jgi:hypothetical protein
MKPWIWWFVVFAGTMLMGAGLRTFFTAENRTSSTIAMMIGEVAVGLAVVGFALWRIINAGHALPSDERDENLRITE